MAAMIGTLGEFDPAQESWTQYSERLAHFFTANCITEEPKKKSSSPHGNGTDSLQAATELGSTIDRGGNVL